jgi:ADP-ribose pyrophosphatase YjhB (NUDIX family)
MVWKTWRGYRDAKEKFLHYKNRGFFQFRFPGGTSENGEINAVVIIAVFDPIGKVLFVVVPYDPKSNLENKVGDKKELAAHLAVRKAREETGLEITICSLRPILKVIVADNRYKDVDKKHTKYFYLVEKFEGSFINLDNSSFLNTETATPFLAPGELVAKEIYWGHFAAFKEAIRRLSPKIKNEELYSIELSIEKRETLIISGIERKKIKKQIKYNIPESQL